jgi:hypothetical protein
VRERASDGLGEVMVMPAARHCTVREREGRGGGRGERGEVEREGISARERKSERGNRERGYKSE